MLPTLTTEQNDLLNDMMREHFGPTIDDIPDDKEMFTDRGIAPGPNQFDSLDRVDFVMALEDQFHIEIPDQIAAVLRTKADLRQHLATLLEQPATDR